MDRAWCRTEWPAAASAGAGSAALAVLRRCLTGAARPMIGNALFLEYEDVLSREGLFAAAPIDPDDRAVLLDAVLGACQWIHISYLWRPNLRDESDNHLVELAVAGNAAWIVTGSERDVAAGEGLQKRLAGGEKALIGNSAYRRYLRRTGAGKAFEIDAGKLADEARFDGIFVLRTNAAMTPLNAVLRYRDLLQVEDLFRRAKAQLHTRPIYHSCDAAIRGHVFCSFLALVLQPGRRRDGRVGRSDPRSRPPPGGDHREGRQARHHPHTRLRPGRIDLPGRRRRPPAQLARTNRLTPTTPK